MMLTYWLLVVVGFAVTMGQDIKIPIVPCRGQTITGILDEVRVSNCEKLPCTLKKGSKVTVSFDYRTGLGTNGVTNGVYGIIGGASLPFLGVNGTPACTSIKARSAPGNPCPQQAGQSFTYSNTFPIHRIYPTTNVNVQWELRDDANQKIVCFIIPAKII